MGRPRTGSVLREGDHFVARVLLDGKTVRIHLPAYIQGTPLSDAHAKDMAKRLSDPGQRRRALPPVARVPARVGAAVRRRLARRTVAQAESVGVSVGTRASARNHENGRALPLPLQWESALGSDNPTCGV